MKKLTKDMKQKAELKDGESMPAVKLNKESFEVISEVAGEDVVTVVEYLRDKKNISEFKIAEDINEEVNAVRSMLYRLHSNNLVTYYRKKDRQKGWYISYWTFNPPGLKHATVMLQRRKLVDLKERLKREEDNRDLFFMCPGLCTRMDFDNATDVSFKCPECGKTMVSQENSKTIALLRTKINEMES